MQVEFTTLTKDAVNKCNVDIRNDLYKNVVLAGGSTLFNEIGSRLEKELLDVIAPNFHFSVIMPPERKYSSWIGGSILGSLSTFVEIAISRAEYEEYGPNIVNIKCF